tara:strand:- start:500 stop:766 length:267 start_codon:yes stop_codon:yes gene_type:complete
MEMHNMKTIEVPILEEFHGEYGDTELVTETKLNKIPKREFFRLTPTGKAVYLKVEYDRARKGYYCENYESGSERFIKSNKTVYIGFTY